MHVIAAPPRPAPRRISAIPAAVIVEDDDDDVAPGPHTSEMTAAELDDAIPERASELSSEQLLRPRIDLLGDREHCFLLAALVGVPLENPLQQRRRSRNL